MRWIVAAGLALGIGFSFNLWFGFDRLFPKVSAFGTGWVSPAIADALLAAGAVAGCVLFAYRPRWRWAAATALLCGLGLALFDRIRWQPWCYQYWLTLLVVLAPAATADPARGLNPVRWIMVATYLWSGINKCNSGFIRFYLDTIGNVFIPGSMGDVIDTLAYAAGPGELLIGALLAFGRTRKAGVLLACGLHLWILVFLGPLFGGDNQVIWPWNTAMIALVITLFWNHEDNIWQLPAEHISRAVAAVIAVLVFVMPALSLKRLWPHYFSFHLYSGPNQRLQLVLSPSGVDKLDDRHRALMIPSPISEPSMEIDFHAWALDELKVPVAEDTAVLLHLGHELADRFPFETGDAIFFYRDFPPSVDQWRRGIYTPEEMRQMRDFLPSRQEADPP